MKKIIFISVLFAALLPNLLFSQLLVGKLENGQPVLTADKAKLISSLNTSLTKITGAATNFNSVSITKVQNYYYLIFKGGTTKSAFSIEVEGEKLYANPISITCTTSDCASEELGCLPSGTRCTECANKGKCTKTISDGALIAN